MTKVEGERYGRMRLYGVTETKLKIQSTKSKIYTTTFVFC